MKPLFAVTLVVLLVPLSRGGPNERAIVAAMKLSEVPSYSWSATFNDDARTYDVEGKTDRTGYTWMRMPIVKDIAQRLGRDADPQLEAVFKDAATYVIRTDKGWKTLKELPKRNWDWNDDIDLWPSPMTPRGIRAAAMSGVDPFGFPTFPAPVLVAPPPIDDDDDNRPYCNAQFALSRPHEELAVIVSSYTALHVEGDVATGTLSDIGAQLLLVRDGQDHINPVCAAGAFKLHLKGGLVTRYSLKLEGILVVNKKRYHVHQESNTDVLNVGTTVVQLTDDIRRRLGP